MGFTKLIFLIVAYGVNFFSVFKKKLVSGQILFSISGFFYVNNDIYGSYFLRWDLFFFFLFGLFILMAVNVIFLRDVKLSTSRVLVNLEILNILKSNTLNTTRRYTTENPNWFYNWDYTNVHQLVFPAKIKYKDMPRLTWLTWFYDWNSFFLVFNFFLFTQARLFLVRPIFFFSVFIFNFFHWLILYLTGFYGKQLEKKIDKYWRKLERYIGWKSRIRACVPFITWKVTGKYNNKPAISLWKFFKAYQIAFNSFLTYFIFLRVFLLVLPKQKTQYAYLIIFLKFFLIGFSFLSLALFITFFYFFPIENNLFAENEYFPFSVSWLWLNFGNGSISITLKITDFNVLMLWVVVFITVLVLFFSSEYMANDPRRRVFLAHVIIFSIFMCIFIVSDDLVTAFLGWEGVGLSSFFLINFWYTRLQANKASFKAILVNKIGDSFFLAAIGLCFYQWKTVSFSLLWDSSLHLLMPDEIWFQWNNYVITTSGIVTCLLILAAMAKSAQLGLHTWLPDAMEGPTPVSALIHAATMVTAGILLIIKTFPLLLLHPLLGFFMACVGAITSVVAGLTACVQHDIKKIIAYSTCSQLGLMFMACGMGYPEFSFFHLITHAFFKALLFLSAGTVVHYVNNEQDIRKMGGLSIFMPLTNVAFFFGNLCIMGFPFYSGFYSKEILVLGSSQFSFFLFCLTILSTLLTSFYSCRLQWYVMWRPTELTTYLAPTLKKWYYFLPLRSPISAEAGLRTASVLISLIFFSVVVGYFLSNYFLVFSFHSQYFWTKAAQGLVFEQSLSTVTKLLPLFLIVGSASFYFYLQYKWFVYAKMYLFLTDFTFKGWRQKYSELLENKKLRYPFTIKYIKYSNYYFCKMFYDMLSLAWFFNPLINRFAIKIYAVSRIFYELLDRGFVEFFLGARRIFSLSTNFRSLHFFVSGKFFFLYLILPIIFIVCSVIIISWPYVYYSFIKLIFF